MQIVETTVAGLALAACALLLLRLVLPVRRRARFDAAFRGAWRAMQHAWRSAVTAPGRRRAAEREARQIIERARQPRPDEAEGEWQGNVFRPKSFKRPKKPH
jgi:hypothetical protein